MTPDNVSPEEPQKTADDDAFMGLGFSPTEAAALSTGTAHIQDEKTRIKMQLISAILGWVSEKQLTQTGAARMLGITSARMSDIKNLNASSFTLDYLVELLLKPGKRIELSVR